MKKQLLSLIAFAFISLTVSAQVAVNPDIYEQRYIFGTSAVTSDDPTTLTNISILRDVNYTKTAVAQPGFNGTYEGFNLANTANASFIDGLSLQSTADIPNAKLIVEARQRLGGIMTVTVTVDGTATVFSDLDENSSFYEGGENAFKACLLPIENVSFTNGVAKTIKIDVLSSIAGTGNLTQLRIFNVRVINNDVSLSTKDFIAENGIQLYPNPATDSFELNSKINVNNVQIFSITGQLVKTLESVTNRYDISDLKSGLYLATINTDSGSGSMKLIKQ